MREEVDFWASWLGSGGLQWKQDFTERLDPNLPLSHELIINFLKQLPQEVISILDVGAGPLTALGKVYPHKRLLIRAIDPLADQYDRLLSELHIEPPVRTIKCSGEALVNMFGPDTFDIAFAQNALDHSSDPVLVIENMLEVIREPGYVLLRHVRNEGQNQQYSGLHQWNFDVSSGNLIVWNRAMKHDLNAVLGKKAFVRASLELEGEDWVVNAIITRRTRPPHGPG